MPKTDYEVIVINDASTDLTSYALSQFHNEIKVIENAKNCGLPYSLNRGIEIATGEYIVRLDSDDYVNENYLIFLYETLAQNHPDCRVVSCDYFLVDDKEKFLERKFFKDEPIGCALMMHKTVFREIGLYNEEFLRHEDKELHSRLISNNIKVYNLPLVLYRYRMHDSNITLDIDLMSKYEKKLDQI
jgi:glycosyltransferase involved in cell wall biosynthesis